MFLISFKAVFKRQYEILTASSIHEALEYENTNEFDVFISDERLPHGIGLETIVIVKEKKPEVVCILMTAYDYLTVVQEAINQWHVYYYLSKPWDEDQLGLVLMKAIERQKSTRELQNKTRALEKAYYELDQLVYSASHNMRSPLSNIAGLITLIKSEYANKEATDNYLNLIEDSTTKMLEMLESLSHFSDLRIYEEVDSSFNSKNLIESILRTLRKKPIHKTKHIQTSITCVGEEEVWLPQKKMKVLLYKSIENAFQYFSKDKAEHNVHVGIQNTSNELNIAVKDNGHGLMADKTNEIFNMFYRGSSQSTRAGMGLYLAQEIITMLGGTIEVKSLPNHEKIFTLRIPLVQQVITD